MFRSPFSGSRKCPGSGRNLIPAVSFSCPSALHDSLMSGELSCPLSSSRSCLLSPITFNYFPPAKTQGSSCPWPRNPSPSANIRAPCPAQHCTPSCRHTVRHSALHSLVTLMVHSTIVPVMLSTTLPTLSPSPTAQHQLSSWWLQAFPSEYQLIKGSATADCHKQGSLQPERRDFQVYPRTSLRASLCPPKERSDKGCPLKVTVGSQEAIHTASWHREWLHLKPGIRVVMSQPGPDRGRAGIEHPGLQK